MTTRALVRQIFRRGALIFLVGLLINGFPFFTWGSVDGVLDTTVGQRVVDRLLHWRIMGVHAAHRPRLPLWRRSYTLRTTLKQQLAGV